MTQNKKATPVGTGAASINSHSADFNTTRDAILRQITDNISGNSAVTQQQRIMAALRSLGSVSTVECTRYLDIVHPPRRVMELREAGNFIVTHWKREPTECGRLHRVGCYVLETRP